MLRTLSAFPLLAILLSTGCSGNQTAGVSGNDLVSTDFEGFDGWLGNSASSLSKNQAHSGKYSTTVGPGQEYSLGYSNELGKISTEWPAKLTVGAWVLVSGGRTNAKLVTEVKQSTSNPAILVWEGVALSKAVTAPNKWQYVESTITMPPTAKPNSVLQVYLWGATSSQPVYLDDLKISRVQ